MLKTSLTTTDLRQERSTLESLSEEDVNDRVHSLSMMQGGQSRVEDDVDERVEDDDLEVIFIGLAACSVHQERDVGLGRSDVLVGPLVNFFK